MHCPHQGLGSRHTYVLMLCYLILIIMLRRDNHVFMITQWSWTQTWNLFLWTAASLWFSYAMHYWYCVVIASFIRQLNFSHVGHMLAMDPCSAYIMDRKIQPYWQLQSLSNVVGIHVLHIIKRKSCLQNGTVMIDRDKNRLVKFLLVVT